MLPNATVFVCLLGFRFIGEYLLVLNWRQFERYCTAVQRVCPINDDGHSISRDLDGFPLTSSGTPQDSMVVLKQESRFAKANHRSFTQFSMQIEQGIPVFSKWLIFNRFKFVTSKGLRLGPAFLLTRSAFNPFGEFSE